MFGDSNAPLQCSIATVDAVRVMDDRSAILVDCTLQPSGTKAALRLASPYVGGGFGLVALPRDGDEVLALFPGGDLNAGIAIWGLFNGVDKAPAGSARNLILIEGRDGDDLRMHIRGKVDVQIDGAETESIGGNRADAIGGNDAETIQGNKTTTVRGNASMQVTGSLALAATGPLTIRSVVSIDMTAPLIRMFATTASLFGNLNVAGNIWASGRIDDSTGNTPNHSHG